MKVKNRFVEQEEDTEKEDKRKISGLLSHIRNTDRCWKRVEIRSCECNKMNKEIKLKSCVTYGGNQY